MEDLFRTTSFSSGSALDGGRRGLKRSVASRAAWAARWRRCAPRGAPSSIRKRTFAASLLARRGSGIPSSRRRSTRWWARRCGWSTTAIRSRPCPPPTSASSRSLCLSASSMDRNVMSPGLSGYKHVPVREGRVLVRSCSSKPCRCMVHTETQKASEALCRCDADALMTSMAGTITWTARSSCRTTGWACTRGRGTGNTASTSGAQLLAARHACGAQEHAADLTQCVHEHVPEKTLKHATA